jgi:hypothetical protein
MHVKLLLLLLLLPNTLHSFASPHGDAVAGTHIATNSTSLVSLCASLGCPQLFVGGALLSADAVAVHRMRPKRRVLLVRFIAKALLSPYYRSEWTAAPLPPVLKPEQRAQVRVMWCCLCTASTRKPIREHML